MLGVLLVVMGILGIVLSVVFFKKIQTVETPVRFFAVLKIAQYRVILLLLSTSNSFKRQLSLDIMVFHASKCVSVLVVRSVHSCHQVFIV